MKTIYHIDSSARKKGSYGRSLAFDVVSRLKGDSNSQILYRDVSQGLEFLTPEAIEGLYIPDSQKTDAQKRALKLSDQIVNEIKQADYLVISAPIYNFGPPASLKAWADLVARKDKTFSYTNEGPKGLLKDIKTFVVVTSGGVPLGSPVDHLSPWLKSFLSFLGVTDITFLAADLLAIKEEETLERVKSQIRSIAPISSTVSHVSLPA